MARSTDILPTTQTKSSEQQADNERYRELTSLEQAHFNVDRALVACQEVLEGEGPQNGREAFEHNRDVLSALSTTFEELGEGAEAVYPYTHQTEGVAIAIESPKKLGELVNIVHPKTGRRQPPEDIDPMNDALSYLQSVESSEFITDKAAVAA